MNNLDELVTRYELAVDNGLAHGRLEYGVEYEGELHYTFSMRLATVRDDVIAEAATDESQSDLARLMARCSRLLVSLGTVPSEAITADLVMDGIINSDVDALIVAQELLLKKRKRPNGA